MKKITTLFILLLIAVLTITAQPPQAFKYKAIARDKFGRLILNQQVAMRISILQGSGTGMAVYIETHTPFTNLFGIIELEIGKGTPELGTISAIDWGASDYYIKIEMDPKNKGKGHGNEGYTVIGTSQLLSVPYALYAGHVQNSEDNDADPINELITNAYLSGSILTILEGSNTTLIDLSGLQDGFEDADADPENEIQDLQLVDNILTITQNGTATEIDLSVYLDDTDTHLTEVEVDAMVGNNGYLTSEVDGSVINEIQDISIEGHMLTISVGGTVQLPDSVNDADHDPFNELQELALNGTELTIMGKNTVDLAVLQDGVNDADFDPTNELQVLSIGHDTIYLSGGGYVKLPEQTSGSWNMDAMSQNIINLANPMNNQDAATKIYVDVLMQRIEDLEGLLSGSNISDIDGNIYDLVTIGEQVWMADNLKTTKLNNGNPITLISNLNEWHQNDGSYEKRVPMVCWYDFETANKNIYGGLYNRYCVERNICPTGWHVPSADEWEILLGYIHDNMPSPGGPGDKMKSTGTIEGGDGLWHQYRDRTTNETGFSGLPGGLINDYGDRFERLGYKGDWWGYYISSHLEEEFSVVELSHDSDGVESNAVNRFGNPGYSVRCIKD